RRHDRVRKRTGRTPRRVRSEAASVAESATSREDLLRVQEELTEIGRARRAVEAAAQASPAVELPVDQALPRRLFFGELVVRVANTELELEPLGPLLPLQDRNERFEVVVVDGHLGVEVAGGVDADDLVREGHRRLQDI